MPSGYMWFQLLCKIFNYISISRNTCIWCDNRKIKILQSIQQLWNVYGDQTGDCPMVSPMNHNWIRFARIWKHMRSSFFSSSISQKTWLRCCCGYKYMNTPKCILVISRLMIICNNYPWMSTFWSWGPNILGRRGRQWLLMPWLLNMRNWKTEESRVEVGSVFADNDHDRACICRGYSIHMS